MKILILDNYDSFTYNLAHLVKSLGFNDVDVYRNDKIDIDDISGYDKIILSPGPGIPSEAGIMKQLIEKYADNKPILGVCLGHQAIGEAFGGKLKNLEDVYHGISTTSYKTSSDYILDGLNDECEIGRYHSWIVEKNGLPECLEVTMQDKDGQIMALKHKTYDVHGVQFHPESVLTPEGYIIIQNFLKH